MAQSVLPRSLPAKRVVGVLLVMLAAAGCGGDGDDGSPVVEHLVARVVDEHPHDPTAFTQGLEVVDGVLWESTGLRGESTLRAVDRTTGRLLGSVALEPDLFGEGLTALGDGRLLQLTWTAGRALVWAMDTLTVVDEWDYEGQGWGACRLDESTIVVSDGSTRLSLRDAGDFTEAAEVEVRLDGEPVDDLNELECVDGTVWANVWHTDRIVGIDPSTGDVAAVVDASGLPVDRTGLGNEDVLNGIAHDPATGRFLLTGKRWPALFDVAFVAEE